MAKQKDTETSYFNVDELRAMDQGEGKLPKIVGYAAVFNSTSNDLGGFKERIAPGAFAESLASKRNIVATGDSHDMKRPLGQTKNDTLVLREDSKGLYMEITPANTQAGRDNVELVRRGDVTQASFSFPNPSKENIEWKQEGDTQIRTLKKIDLREVTLTYMPAYEATTISLRTKSNIDRPEIPTPRIAELERRMRLIDSESIGLGV